MTKCMFRGWKPGWGHRRQDLPEKDSCQEKWLWNNSLFPCHLSSDLSLYWLHLSNFLKVKDLLSSSVLAWSSLISINKSLQDRGVKNNCTYWLLHFRGAELFPAIKGNLSFLGSVKIGVSNNSVSYFTTLQGLSCCSLIALFFNLCVTCQGFMTHSQRKQH